MCVSSGEENSNRQVQYFNKYRLTKMYHIRKVLTMTMHVAQVSNDHFYISSKHVQCANLLICLSRNAIKWTVPGVRQCHWWRFCGIKIL